MLAVAIQITDRATPVVRSLGYALSPQRANPIIGRSARSAIQEHLYAANNARPNALGGTRTNYYATAADRTHFTVVDDGVLISISQIGFRQKIVGGTITPGKNPSSFDGKPTKYLTVPARAEAHGKRASAFPDLVVVFGHGGRPVALARAWQTVLPSQRGAAKSINAGGHIVGASRQAGSHERGGEILFWLVDSVTVQPDPSLLPSEADLFARIQADLAAYVKIAADRALRPGAN